MPSTTSLLLIISMLSVLLRSSNCFQPLISRRVRTPHAITTTKLLSTSKTSGDNSPQSEVKEKKKVSILSLKRKTLGKTILTPTSTDEPIVKKTRSALTPTPAEKIIISPPLTNILDDNEDDDDNYDDDEMEEIVPTPSATSTSTSKSKSHVTDALFSQLDISANSKKAIDTVLKYQQMTIVQKECIPAVLTGADCFVKAKTGTGKTLGFLIPR